MGLIYLDGSPLKWSKIQRGSDSPAPFDEVTCNFVTLGRGAGEGALVAESTPLVTPGKNTGPSVSQPQVPDSCPKPCELKEESQASDTSPSEKC